MDNNEVLKAVMLEKVRRERTRRAQTPAAVNPRDEQFTVHTRGGAQVTNTLNVPADKGDQALREIGESTRRVSAKVAPVVVPVAAGLMLGPQAGFATRTAMAGLGGAAGEAGAQLLDAAGGKVEKSPAEAAKKIGKAGALNAAFSAAGEGAVGAAKIGFSAVRNVGRTFLDFLANVRRGTAATAGRVPASAVTDFTPETIKTFGQDVADAIKNVKKARGADIADALGKVDEAAPEGTIPIEEVQEQFIRLKKGLRVNSPIRGVDKPTENAVANIEDDITRWIERSRKTQPAEVLSGKPVPGSAPTRDKLTLREAKDLLDRAREAIPFDATNPGASKAAKQRLLPFSEWLRGRIGQVSPAADKALKSYGQLVDDSDAVEQILGVTGGEKITPARLADMERALQKFLRTGEVTDKVLEQSLKRLNAGELTPRGKGLAVSAELRRDAPTTSGEGGIVGLASRALRGVTAPAVRGAFFPVSRALNAARLPEAVTRSAGASAGNLIAAMSRKREKSDGKR